MNLIIIPFPQSTCSTHAGFKLPLQVKRSVLSMALQLQPALPYAMVAAKVQHGFFAVGDDGFRGDGFRAVGEEAVLDPTIA